MFLAAAGALGDRLLRVPDGETGERSGWIGWQAPHFAEGAYFLSVPPDPAAYRPRHRARLRPGVSPTDVRFGPLGYAQAARRSYATFVRLRHEGRIPAHYRFQVCLPTPLGVVTSFMVPGEADLVVPAYGHRLRQELVEIQQAVPAETLAVQWDVAVEFAILEGVLPGGGRRAFDGISERLLELGAAVPPESELGYHLCYGDAGHRHFVEPADTALLVQVANALASGLARPLNWIHLPVPRERADEAYLAPLRHRQLRPETELYLGLVHMTDGLAGSLRRLDAASRVVDLFGISTECGLGRRPPESIPALLQLLARVAAA